MKSLYKGKGRTPFTYSGQDGDTRGQGGPAQNPLRQVAVGNPAKQRDDAPAPNGLVGPPAERPTGHISGLATRLCLLFPTQSPCQDAYRTGGEPKECGVDPAAQAVWI